ncbi:hypothetical protein TVAG_038040 [Trichomonas vaginalis G3]|uniref:Ubiquitin-like domain-containing protein n=1 Tax=Trichomonas vaginalis (strain ATCC PRA-98 / G3) TaxID=412133 RepID=A2DXW2_TRIV3|nr:ubiquitin-like family [Trichomonas vaginalis G3]EAY14698.1 hypothetical protein TVAG_038040 [Trichomonas vaginalis G3]KAI5487930.1 ubiquitin-like family [Trichomonas vaginalis G3]|eukprot:XP_001326921.1 hypothetical protein [Trichomonas vaginalis G3]
MSVTLTIKYPGVATPQNLKNVDYSTTIEKLKKVLIKINKSDVPLDAIKVVHKGRILQNDNTVGDLTVDEGQTSTIFVTGIKPPVAQPKPAAPQEPQAKPVLPEVPPPQPLPQMQPQPAQNPLPQFQQNLFAQQNNNAPRQGNIFEKYSSLLGLALSIIVIFAIFTFVFLSISKNNAVSTVITLVIVVAFFAYLFRNVRWTIPMVSKCLMHFFLSLTPFWNLQQFMAEEGANRN